MAVDRNNLTSAYYRNAVGAMLVYDITNYVSFENIEKWLCELSSNATTPVEIMMIGNKSDLRHLRAVTQEEAMKLAENCKIHFLETSALDSSNIELAFQTILERIYQKHTTTVLESLSSEKLKEGDPVVLDNSVDQNSKKERKHGKKCCIDL